MTIADTAPIIKNEGAGTYYPCASRMSENQPYCDGSHQGSDIEPKKVVLEEGRRMAWCACKQSRDGHACDGSHRML
jgi:CDGSH-type Zn-finger protein